MSTGEINEETYVEIDKEITYRESHVPPKPKDNSKKYKTLRVNNILEELIQENNLISKESILILHNKSKSYMEDVLESNSINQSKFFLLLSKKMDLDFYSGFHDLEANLSTLDRSIISDELLKKFKILIFKKNNYTLEIVTSNPFDYEIFDFIQNKTPLTITTIKIALSEEKNITKILRKFQKNSLKDYTAVISREHQHGFTKKDLNRFNDETTDLPVIEFVQYVVLEAKKAGASDIHIEPTEDETVIRYRIDGVLQTEITLPLKVHREIISRIKIISDMNVAEKRLPQDGRFDITDENGSKMDMRVSTFPIVYGEKIVMRLLEQDSLKPSLEDLNLDDEDLELLQNKINSPYGLILITGPTGSGKTTTLYSALSSIDKDTQNVLTVEDPVEYRLEGINQMQTNDKIGLTFANGLRTILRQDPDIVMVGEMRDLETANMAIQASLTGHIVFSTLHTNDSIGVIIRLINMGVEPFLVSSAVSLTVAQRLIRKICPDCIAYKNSKQLQEELEENGITANKLESMRITLDEEIDSAYGKGCSNCRGTGYRGRQAVFEFFEPNLEINKEILKPDFNEAKIRAIAKENGMRTLLDNGLELVDEGITTIEEIIRVIGE
jgi:type IV pilus assembly protein PilB